MERLKLRYDDCKRTLKTLKEILEEDFMEILLTFRTKDACVKLKRLYQQILTFEAFIPTDINLKRH